MIFVRIRTRSDLSTRITLNDFCTLTKSSVYLTKTLKELQTLQVFNFKGWSSS